MALTNAQKQARWRARHKATTGDLTKLARGLKIHWIGDDLPARNQSGRPLNTPKLVFMDGRNVLAYLRNGGSTDTLLRCMTLGLCELRRPTKR